MASVLYCIGTKKPENCNHRPLSSSSHPSILFVLELQTHFPKKETWGEQISGLNMSDDRGKNRKPEQRA